MAGNIRRRGKGSWELTIELPSDPVTGERRRRFVNVKGTKREASQRLTELEHQRDSGIDITPNKLTVATYLERWLRDYAATNVAASTYERYAGIIRKHIVPGIGELRLSLLRPMHVQALYAKWSEAGLSAKTILHQHRLLHQAFNHACDWQLLVINPITAVKPLRPERKEVRVLDNSQLSALLFETDRAREPLGTIVRFALWTGMREGEILALRWSDVDLESRSLRVVRTARRFTGLGIVYGQPKTFRSRRPIQLESDAITMLRDHRARQLETRLATDEPWKDPELVFTGPTGQPIDARNLLRNFHAATVAAGLGKLPFHTLRHTCGTMMAAANVNPRAIADRLGHANATFTLITYVHTTGDIEQHATEAIAEALRKAAN